MKSHKVIESWLTLADIKINGSRPEDILIHNDRFYDRVLAEGSIGLGDSYIEEWWECQRLDQFFFKVLRSKLPDKIKFWRLFFYSLKSKFINLQHKSRAFEIGQKHYDIGNDLYQAMLDKRLVYTCGYWKDAEDLDSAQEGKLDLVCQKLGLKSGMTLLDIGCGWGSFLKYAAEKYGVKGYGITVSKEQVKLGRNLCKDLPIQIKLKDYRDIQGKFDRIVSLGMFEHVGFKNYLTYMKQVHRSLKDDGLFLLQTIGSDKSYTTMDPWFEKHIFPNSLLPSVSQIANSVNGLFVMEDWHNFGSYYDKTLMSWFKNFDRNWAHLKAKYDKAFYRKWKYYLLSSAGNFRSRYRQLWQIVFSKTGLLGGYSRYHL